MEDDELEVDAPAMEMLDSTEAYLALIDRIAVENFGALETVRGNLLFAVQGIAVRHVVTSGPLKGLYDRALDEPAHFMLAIQQWALLQLLEPDPEHPLTIDDLVERGAADIQGDVKVYQRFMALDSQKKGLVSIRLS